MRSRGTWLARLGLWIVYAGAAALCLQMPVRAAQFVPTAAAALLPRAASEPLLVERVHRHFNALRRVSDRRMWGQDDYWATPAELLRAGGGDCEDVAVAKYFALRERGVPARRLRLVYARLFDGTRDRFEAHVVLWYRPDGAAEWRVLDSLRERVQRVGERRDLLPRLLFNELQVARWEVGGTEAVLGGTDLLQPWHRLLARARLLDSVALVLRIHAL